jgi:hypothetical protein
VRRRPSGGDGGGDGLHGGAVVSMAIVSSRAIVSRAMVGRRQLALGSRPCTRTRPHYYYGYTHLTTTLRTMAPAWPNRSWRRRGGRGRSVASRRAVPGRAWIGLGSGLGPGSGLGLGLGLGLEQSQGAPPLPTHSRGEDCRVERDGGRRHAAGHLVGVRVRVS